MTEERPFCHVPVLPREVLAGLVVQEGGNYVDCTVGGGGHSALILSVAPNISLTAIDRDRQALQAAQTHLAPLANAGQLRFWQGNFQDFGTGKVLFDGILADLGVSSAQLDFAERGFSFRGEAALDMRMDQSQAQTAAHLVNTTDERQLANLIFQLGEERFSRRIARGIIESRPLLTTTQLVEVIMRSVPAPYRRGRIHPATRTFQALRLAVNQELESLQTLLHKAPDWLVPGGRLVVISFHSLEDRLVKQAFREDERLQNITKKPIVPSPEEIRQNPRSRSAKLRIAERKACPSSN